MRLLVLAVNYCESGNKTKIMNCYLNSNTGHSQQNVKSPEKEINHWCTEQHAHTCSAKKTTADDRNMVRAVETVSDNLNLQPCRPHEQTQHVLNLCSITTQWDTFNCISKSYLKQDAPCQSTELRNHPPCSSNHEQWQKPFYQQAVAPDILPCDHPFPSTHVVEAEHAKAARDSQLEPWTFQLYSQNTRKKKKIFLLFLIPSRRWSD